MTQWTDEQLHAEIARCERMRRISRYCILAGMIVKVVALIAIMLFMHGCAALPMPFQPRDMAYNSNLAEGSFVALNAVDTAQTMHFRAGTPCAYEADPLARFVYGSRTPPPGRVLLVNAALVTVHTMIASWLDDRVAEEDRLYESEDRYGLGPWYGLRFVFHAVSLVAEGSAVVNNFNRGCKL
jgi:hypothetical protein